jgi:hypothetical protein
MFVIFEEKAKDHGKKCKAPDYFNAVAGRGIFLTGS